MNLKNIVFVLLGALVFAACDNIGEDDRYLPVEGAVTDRVVLLTEFTGMACVNCPEAAEIAHSMLDKYPENLIVVAMHPKGHGFVPEGQTPDLARTEAMDYLKAMGGSQSTGFPTGVVDFVEKESSYLMDRSEWAARIVQRVAVEAKCSLALEKSHIGGTSYEVKATLNPKENYSGKVSVIFWLVESGMIGSQASHEGTIKDYVHNHALRECLNGLWGKEMSSLTGTVEETVTFEVKPEYVANNCSVVAVAIDPANNEVLQAAEIALGEEGEK